MQARWASRQSPQLSAGAADSESAAHAKPTSVITQSKGFIRPRAQLFVLAVLSSAARNPLANLMASSFAQKCMKISRGCSVSM